VSDSLQDGFFTAIILGNTDDVKSILPDHPEALSWLTPAGYPPLHMAILNHRNEIAVCLVEYGADLNQAALGETAASLADRKGMLEMLEAAAARQDQRRNESIDACGERMHAGLRNPVSVPRKSLSLKPRQP
jgi:ankyrin repeat protein